MSRSLKQAYTRTVIWRHNAAIGSSVMMRRNAHNISRMPTATPRAKDLADRIELLAFELEMELRRNRVDTTSD